MRYAYRFCGGTALVLLGWASTTCAQLPVTDAIVSLQTTLTAVSAADTVLNQILELTGLDEILLGDDLSDDLTILGSLSTEANGLIMDLTSIQRAVDVLFDLDNAPSSSGDLQQRLQDIRRLSWQVYRDALAVQTLLQSSLSAGRHVVRLIEGVGDLLGNQQSNQTLIQLEVKLTVELAKLRATTDSFHRAQILDHLADPFIAESMDRIRDNAMADWPRPEGTQ